MTHWPRTPCWLCAFLLGALWGGGPRVFAFPGDPVLDLRSTAVVDSSGVYLHQLVSEPLADRLPQSIRVAAAPAMGRTLTLSRGQLQDQLAQLAPDLAGNGWSGAEQVRIARRTRALAETELRDLLTATLQKELVREKGDLELRFSRPWTVVMVPDEMLTLKVLDLPVSGVSANFIVRFELQLGPDRFGPWQVVVQARVMKEVLIARTSLRRGQPLVDSDFTTERRDLLALREAFDPSALRNPALELIEGVSAGQPLLARAVRTRPVVQRGQIVDGLVRDGSLQINLRVEVLGDGLPGQLVRVRNPKTKREFYGRVQDEQTVLINL